MVMEVVMLKMEAAEVTGMEDDRSDKNMGGNNKDNKKQKGYLITHPPLLDSSM